MSTMCNLSAVPSHADVCVGTPVHCSPIDAADNPTTISSRRGALPTPALLIAYGSSKGIVVVIMKGVSSFRPSEIAPTFVAF